MFNDYPKFKRGEIEKFYNSIPNSEKKVLKEYIEYRQARGLESVEKVKDLKRYILQFRFIIQKDYKKFDNLQDLRGFLALITKTKNLSDSTKNNFKIDLRNFLQFLFPDWSLRFSNLTDIKTHSIQKNEEKINTKTILSKEDVEKIMKHETEMFWKAFFITQYEAGLRTGETRRLKWEDIKFNADKQMPEISEITIYATKTKKSRPSYVKEATFYLQRLKEEQDNNKINSVYVFPSKSNVNEPVGKTPISDHFRPVFKKSLGRKGWNYLLRHSRATELYKLAEEGKISKDTAIRFMGHSDDMSKIYTHLDKDVIKEMLKNQIYKLEDLPEEKKHELLIKMEGLEKELKQIKNTASANNKILFILAKDKMEELKGNSKKEFQSLLNIMSEGLKKEK